MIAFWKLQGRDRKRAARLFFLLQFDHLFKTSLGDLLLFADDAERTLFFDEPDNYITLPELQPWLAELEDGCGDTLPQTILISHHPEAIDFLSDKAVWLGREPESHTRLLDVKNDTMLKTSELYAQELAL